MQQTSNAPADVLNACKHVRIFNDDRDRVILRLNCLLASIGIGKSFYEHGKCVQFERNNIFQLFRGICYNQADRRQPLEGEVCLLVGYPVHQLEGKVENELFRAIVGSSGASLSVVGLRDVSPVSSIVSFLCRSQDRVIPADQLIRTVMGSPQITSHLRNLQVHDVFLPPKVTETSVEAMNQRQEEGFSGLEWREAYDRNPHKSKLTMASVFSNAELSRRIFLQKRFTKQNSERMEMVNERVKNIARSLYIANSSMASLRQWKDKMTSRLSRVATHMIGDTFPEELFGRVTRTHQFARNPENFQIPIEEIRVNLSRNPAPLEMSPSASQLNESLTLQLKRMDDLLRIADGLSQRMSSFEKSAVGGVLPGGVL